MSSDAQVYKLAKERFVSGLAGTTKLEIASLIGVVPMGVWAARRAAWGQPAAVRAAAEAALVLLATVLALTRADLLGAVYTAQIAVAMAATMRREKGEMEAMEEKMMKQEEKAFYVSLSRFTLMVLTCVMILAIDFPVTPRRFGKTETYGTGLMDVGTGGFIYSSGMIAGAKGAKGAKRDGIWGAGKRAAPLVILGVVRFVMVRSTGYQEVEVEYGVHWNFFLSLAAVSFGVQLLTMAVGEALLEHPGLLGAFVLGAYQLALRYGVENWVLYAPRTDFLSMNKEGVASIVGYIGLYWLSIAIGQRHTMSTVANKFNLKAIMKELAILALLIIATYVAELVCGPISRRMANLPYVLWILSIAQQNLLIPLVLSWIDLNDPWINSLPSERSSLLVDAVNSHQLLVFLVANLLTGLCNVSIRTLYTPDHIAIGILVIYISAVSVLALVFRKSRE